MEEHIRLVDVAVSEWVGRLQAEIGAMITPAAESVDALRDDLGAKTAGLQTQWAALKSQLEAAALEEGRIQAECDGLRWQAQEVRAELREMVSGTSAKLVFRVFLRHEGEYPALLAAE